jgi:hypothetical protein
MTYFDERHGVFVFDNESSRHYVYRYKKSDNVISDLSAMQNSGLVIDVSPNPFSGSLAISSRLLAVGKIGIKIFDIHGKLISKLTANSLELKAGITWNAGQHPPGLYLLKANIGNKKYTKKLMLQK